MRLLDLVINIKSYINKTLTAMKYISYHYLSNIIIYIVTTDLVDAFVKEYRIRLN
jgi:hypothetical protein